LEIKGILSPGRFKSVSPCGGGGGILGGRENLKKI